MPASTAFSFTKLVVGDLEREARYYENVFEMARLQRVQADLAGSPLDEIILGTDGGPGLILMNWTEQDAPPAGEVILGFTTTDIGDLFHRALASGGRLRQAPAEVEGLRVGVLEDPEGHLAEVVEVPEAPRHPAP
jgi:predicted enzyme related to lactoylglutathione lyase